jgi:hypothetical protein
MNVAELISDAYYLSRVVGRNFETVSAAQSEDGLTLLNDILSEKNISSATIPYTDTINFNGVQGQEQYQIPNLVSLDTLTYVVNDVRYHLNEVNRDRYFGFARVNDIESLPVMFFVERQLGNSNVYVYYVPADNYVFEITGKFALQEVGLFDDISLSYDRFYLSYIKYNLAERICDFNGNTVPSGVQKRLVDLNDQITHFSGLDLSVRVANPFAGKSVDPVQAQLSNGWIAP